MCENKNEKDLKFDISEETLVKWQNMVDLVAKLIGIPAALIMRIVESDIEVFVSSQSLGNPYKPGDHEHFLGSGLYCETVINTNSKLIVPNALVDEKWKNNPDIKLNMISYLGFPILLPNGNPFGTICVLDSQENFYSETQEDLLRSFREVIQYQLELVYMNAILGEKNKNLVDYIDEIETLRGIIPICCNCKKIKDGEGFWTEVERYISNHSKAQFSHGLCEECTDKIYGNEPWYKNYKK